MIRDIVGKDIVENTCVKIVENILENILDNKCVQLFNRLKLRKITDINIACIKCITAT